MNRKPLKETKKRPVKINGYSQAINLAKKNRKQTEAKARNAAWSKLSTDDKLKSLRARRGKSKKQIERLS